MAERILLLILGLLTLGDNIEAQFEIDSGLSGVRSGEPALVGGTSGFVDSGFGIQGMGDYQGSLIEPGRDRSVVRPPGTNSGTSGSGEPALIGGTSGFVDSGFGIQGMGDYQGSLIEPGRDRPVVLPPGTNSGTSGSHKSKNYKRDP